MMTSKVQHVTKASSDQLPRKFAQVGGDDAPAKELRVVKCQKKSRRSRGGHYCESPPNGGSGVVEKRSLLPPATRRSAALLLQLGIGRSQLRVRDLRNKSILGAIEKVIIFKTLKFITVWSNYLKILLACSAISIFGSESVFKSDYKIKALLPL